MRIKNRVAITTLLFSITFFVFHYCAFITVSHINVICSCFIYPFLRVQQFVAEPIKAWQNHYETTRGLEDTIKNLQAERDGLFAENIKLKAMHYYELATNELRDFNAKYLLKHGVVVQVLVRHFSVNNQFFLMNAGAKQGIKKDMVALYNNCIVGRVCEVYPWYCKVYLITDVACKVAAICLPTQAHGIHEGINDEGYTVLRHVSHLDKIQEGNMVFSSGEGLVFPAGFALGAIKSVEKGDLFYTVNVKPVIDFNSLSYCLLVAKEEIEGISLK